MPKVDTIPTPHIGTMVQFCATERFPETDKEYLDAVKNGKICAAQVVGWHNKPGELALFAVPNKRSPMFIELAVHNDSPEAKADPPHVNLRNGGSWRHIPQDETFQHRMWVEKCEQDRIAREKEMERQRKLEQERREKIEEAKLLHSLEKAGR